MHHIILYIYVYDDDDDDDVICNIYIYIYIIDEWQLPKDTLKVVFESVKNLLELGRELTSMSEEKAIDYIQTSTSRQLTSKLPSSERLCSYLTLNELCSIEEWLEIYDRPVHFTLESEKVWPVEPYLKVR